MIVKLLTEHHLEFLSLKGGCRGSSESTHVKMPHCWKSHALAHIIEAWTDLPQEAMGLLILRKPIATCDFPGRGGADGFFLSSTYFIEGWTDLPRVAIGPVHSKEVATSDFRWAGGGVDLDLISRGV